MITQAYAPSQYILNGWFNIDMNTLSPGASSQNDPVHIEYLGKTTKAVLNQFPNPRRMVINSKEWLVYGHDGHYNSTFDLFFALSHRERTRNMKNNATFYRHFDCPVCGRVYPPVDANVFVDLTNKVVVADPFIQNRLELWRTF